MYIYHVMNPKDIRILAGKSMAWVAAMAGVSEPMVKLYEMAGPNAIATPKKRDKVIDFYKKLEKDTMKDLKKLTDNS